jgi:hypothetical protein
MIKFLITLFIGIYIGALFMSHNPDLSNSLIMFNEEKIIDIIGKVREELSND